MRTNGKMLGVLGALCMALAGPVFGAVPSYAWVSGTFFGTNVTAGSNLIGGSDYVVNALWVTNGATNLPGACVVTNTVAGATSMGLLVEIVGDRAPGTTNNGIVRLNFARSFAGGAGPWTTGSNGLSVDVPVIGNTRVVWSTNVPPAFIDGFGALKLLSIGQTNLGGYYVSNVTYRFLRATY